MSLRTDQFFYDAIKASSSILEEVDGRIFNPARSTVDEDEDRVPYIIITLDGGSNDSGTKDDVEGDTDTVSISVLIVHNDRESLAELAEAVRLQCRTFLSQVEDDEESEDYALAPLDWSFSFGEVAYDDMKPCVFQTLRYQCSTNRE